MRREDVHFADVTLACEGHTVKAHRIILCACSSYFQNILKSIDSAKHPVLLLSDVRLGDMTALMDFIYFGQVRKLVLCTNRNFFFFRMECLSHLLSHLLTIIESLRTPYTTLF